jgi:DNA-binding PadR family transcriptional regulator
MRQVWQLFEDFNELRMRRGDVKFAILSALAKRPMHGYDVMRELEEQSHGRYRPSPGSVYPTLQMLEDGGFVRSQTIDGKRVYEITDQGRALLSERPQAEHGEGATDWSDVRDSAGRFVDAIRHGFQAIDRPETRERIRKVIDDARRDILSILAEANS